uniref:Sodium- and chloride-dependent GABA transporter 3-like n=1 Tax=Saccoglossus kowalevskii TaxID=10224 RepID=A0ABM0MCA3_SACKO
AFLIPYIICMVFAGIPLFFLEVSLGQFMSRGGIMCWKICPLFQAPWYWPYWLVQPAWYWPYWLVQSSWHWSYTGLFKHPGTGHTGWFNWPGTGHTGWFNCPGTGHILAGSAALVLAKLASSTALVLVIYWLVQAPWLIIFYDYRFNVLQITDDIKDIGGMRWELAGCLLLAWVICYLCIFKGVKSTGKVVYFTATFPYIMITILLVRGVTLPGAVDGIKFYLIPKWERLLDGKVWIDAGTQIFFSYAVGLGALTALGSYNKFFFFIIRDGIIIACINSITSFYAGFAIFSILGFMAYEQGVAVDEVVDSGPGLAFLAYPKAVSLLP